MGLISEYATVKLNSKNIKRLKELGYDLPMKMGVKGHLVSIKGAEIKVKVLDLTKNSESFVWVECDNCHEKKEMSYSHYNRRKYNDGIHFYCKKCTMCLFQSGEKSCHWKSELTEEERNCQRATAKYNEFIKKVYLRDNHTCQYCGQIRDREMVVHHLDGYNWCKDKRTDVSNGITLCCYCHQNFHLQYGKGNNTREQFEEWIGRSVKDLSDYDGVLPTARKVFCYETKKIYSSVAECSKALGLFGTCIYGCCNHKKGNYSTKGYHFLWEEEYKNMTHEDIVLYMEQLSEVQFSIKKPVICLSIGKRYETIKSASIQKKTSHDSISKSCKNHGLEINGLKWMYIKDFDSLSLENQKELLISSNKQLVSI